MSPARPTLWIAAGLTGAAVVAAYAGTFHAPFIFDDIPSLVENPALTAWRTALFPPAGGLTVSGRPLLQLSFALNHALGGFAVEGYHAANLLIHLLAGLTLCGLLRRTLRAPALAGRCAADADKLALAITGLWLLHPLQTESVTYIVQRAESLASLFYLLTLYCFARGATSAAPRRWFAAAFVACLLGAATKEIVATAPLLALLYDRTFVSDGWREAWRRHRGIHLALATTWLLSATLFIANQGRGDSAGFATPVGIGAYASMQPAAVTHYLRLALWPDPLVLDYGLGTRPTLAGLALAGAVVAALLAFTAVALRRWPAAGFLGAWFFVILAPSSSFIPVATQAMAEHRMYLPLAAVIAAWVLALHRWRPRAAWVLCLGLGFAAAGATAARNRLYASPAAMWAHNVAALPGNFRPRLSLGNLLAEAGQPAAALEQFAAAVRLAPASPDAHYNLGNAYAGGGRWAEAEVELSRAHELNAASVEIRNNLGNVLMGLGRPAEAIPHYAAVSAHSPALMPPHYNLGMALIKAGRPAEALAEFRTVVRLAPDRAEAHFRLGLLLAMSGQRDDAVAAYRTALHLASDYADARFYLAVVLLESGRRTEARAELETLLRLRPDHPDARELLNQLAAPRR